MPVERKKRTIEIITIFKLIEHEPKRILDLGCGSGEITNVLREHGYNIIGLDVSPSNCEAAKNRYPQCDFRYYDGLNLPFEENFFDTVVLNDVFEHISYEHMDKLIENIKEIVKPGGLIYISATNRYELIEPHTLIPFITWFPRKFWNIIDKMFNRTGRYRINEIYPYTFRRLKHFCKRHDLKYEDFTYIYVYHKFSDLEYIGSRALRFLAHLLKKVKLLSLFYHLAYKFSVILFICRVKK